MSIKGLKDHIESISKDDVSEEEIHAVLKTGESIDLDKIIKYIRKKLLFM